MGGGRMTYPDVSLRGHHRVHGACRVAVFVSSSLGMGIAEQKLVRNPGHVKRLCSEAGSLRSHGRGRSTSEDNSASGCNYMHPMGTWTFRPPHVLH